jgi:hypothetical protein
MSNESKIVREETDPVAPDRALEIVLEMSEPVCRLEKSGPTAGFGPSDLYSVS